MEKEKIFLIIEDLLQDCYNDLFEYATSISLKESNLIYDNVELFTLKLKEKIEEIED